MALKVLSLGLTQARTCALASSTARGACSRWSRCRPPCLPGASPSHTVAASCFCLHVNGSVRGCMWHTNAWCRCLVLHGWDHTSLPAAAAGMGNLLPLHPGEAGPVGLGAVHGVLHRLSAADFGKLCCMEHEYRRALWGVTDHLDGCGALAAYCRLRCRAFAAWGCPQAAASGCRSSVHHGPLCCVAGRWRCL